MSESAVLSASVSVSEVSVVSAVSVVSVVVFVVSVVSELSEEPQAAKDNTIVNVSISASIFFFIELLSFSTHTYRISFLC